uniref:Tetratricopeptide repeat protein n=1 Tax=Desulfobacca acetoxidans TaxID=60893 RepID=A0A7V4G8W8_9BACT
MKYCPEGGRGVLVWLLTVVLTLGWPGWSPAMFGELTIEKEKQIGEEFFLQIQQVYPISTDPQITAYINAIGRKLASQLGPQPIQYRFFVIQDPSMNAFAVPGGYVFVTTGFIRHMEREGELAGVLAHEISHIYARHLAKQLDKSKLVTAATVAGALAAVLLGGAAAAPLLAGTMAGGESAMLKYSRDHEREADSLGFKWMRLAGYNPRDMIGVFKKLSKQRWFEGGEIPIYLSTHPHINERLVELGNQFSMYGDRQPEASSSRAFEYFSFKVEATSGNPHQFLRRMTQECLKDPQNPAYHYGKALALARLERPEEALAAFRQAIQLAPGEVILQQELAAFYFERNRYQDALKILEHLAQTRPPDEVTLYYLGRIYQERHQTDKALAAMERVYALNPTVVEVYHSLGTLYGEKGNLGLAHYFLGLHSLRARAYPTALFHFKKARANLSPADSRYRDVQYQISRLEKLRVRVDN